MPYRALAILTLAISLTSAAAGQVTAVGKTKPAKAAAKMWTPPLTPDGQPDLQGVWLSNSATPLERPKALEGREFLTDAEVAELKKRAARLFKTGDSDYASGDNVFLAALANVEQYKSPTATHGADNMIEREFDNRTSLIVDPRDGKVPAVTAEARERQVANEARQRLPAGAEDLSNGLRCITWGVPRLGGNFGAGPYSYYQIFQSPGYVVLMMEVIHDARIIPLDGRPHLPQNIRQWNGDSRGRWDGKTLVVETRNFSPKSNFMGAGENLQLVERFTRVAPDTIRYEITLSDPTTWTKPWTAVMPLKRTQEAVYEYACHEGNYEMVRGMLSAARAEEKVAEEAAKKSSR